MSMGQFLYFTVIAKERSDCGTVGNACGAIRFPLSFGHAPFGADTSSDPAFAGPPSPRGEGFGASFTVGAAIGRPLLPQ